LHAPSVAGEANAWLEEVTRAASGDRFEWIKMQTHLFVCLFFYASRLGGDIIDVGNVIKYTSIE
jgi:hypothetical protein